MERKRVKTRRRRAARRNLRQLNKQMRRFDTIMARHAVSVDIGVVHPRPWWHWRRWVESLT